MVGLDNPIHLAFLLLILLLVFGAKRLPEMGRSLGSGLRGFKEALSGENHAALEAQPDGQRSSELTPAVELTSSVSADAVEQRPAA
jgi:sec-independent protein translocase protein TatA